MKLWALVSWVSLVVYTCSLSTITFTFKSVQVWAINYIANYLLCDDVFGNEGKEAKMRKRRSSRWRWARGRADMGAGGQSGQGSLP